jgi:hypothetical protein
VQGVADGDLVELGEGGLGGVPADAFPDARLALVSAGHVLARLEVSSTVCQRRPAMVVMK